MNCPSCDHDNIPGADLCESCGMDLAGLDVEAWGVDPEDPLLVAKLGDLPLKRPLTLAPSDSVADAMAAMTRHHEGCVFVVDDEQVLAGVFTERDALARIAARGRDPQGTRLESVMTPRPVGLRHDDPLAWAMHRMGVDGYRHLPVLKEERLIGFLSSRTLLDVLRGQQR